MINIQAQDGTVVIDGHGQLELTPEEAFNLASDLIEKAKRAKEQQRDAAKARKDSTTGQ